MSDWAPVTREDRLLAAYHAEVGGRLYTEAAVPWSDGHYDGWPPGYHPLSVDGVRPFGPEYKDEDAIWQFMTHRSEFLELAEGAKLELIEVKPTLNRGVIGQAVVGRDMIAKEYRPEEVRLVVVCGRVNSALEPFCDERDIEVRVCDPVSE